MNDATLVIIVLALSNVVAIGFLLHSMTKRKHLRTAWSHELESNQQKVRKINSLNEIIKELHTELDRAYQEINKERQTNKVLARRVEISGNELQEQQKQFEVVRKDLQEKLAQSYEEKHALAQEADSLKQELEEVKAAKPKRSDVEKDLESLQYKWDFLTKTEKNRVENRIKKAKVKTKE